MDAKDNVVPGWSRTSFSTGLPQRMNLGAWGSFIRASVTATTGEWFSSNSTDSFGISNSLTLPHCRINWSRVCHPCVRSTPNSFFDKNGLLTLHFPIAQKRQAALKACVKVKRFLIPMSLPSYILHELNQDYFSAWEDIRVP